METTAYFQNGFIKEQVGSCRLWTLAHVSRICQWWHLFVLYSYIGRYSKTVFPCFNKLRQGGTTFRTLRYSDTVQCRSQLGLGCAQQRRVFPVSQQGALSIWSGWWWFLKYQIFQYIIASYNVYIYNLNNMMIYNMYQYVRCYLYNTWHVQRWTTNPRVCVRVCAGVPITYKVFLTSQNHKIKEILLL